MSPAKRVAVIGGGPSGLTAIKCCVEAGLEPVCFERNGDPGGLWRYHDEDIEGVASVMKTTIINTSKDMSAFSDFPPPDKAPNYMHNTKMYDYFMQYAKKFDLLKYIRYYSEVVKVEQAEDFDTTGRWIVSVKVSDTVNEERFDAVMVCIGHHVYPNIPTFPSQEKFRGHITHTHSVKNCEQFSGKTVCVVGIGNSGVDAAVDSSFVAKQVYLSTRRGSWILTRVGINGRPYDMDFATRWNFFLMSFLSFNTINNVIEKELNGKFDHEAYNLKPKHRALSAHPTINDALPNCILSGKVAVKGDIQRFEENGIIFDGDDTVTPVDVVILATGYQIRFPFLGDIIRTENNRIELYKYAIPPHLKHPTLALIGLIQPLGPIFPISEIQSRWFAQILLGNIKTPSYEHMMKDIKRRNEENAKRYVNSARHTIQVDFIPFMDEIASEIGAKPNLFKLALTDPKLFLACLTETCLPYQYRLQGPHAWPGAREAILTYEKRVFSALNPKAKGIPRPKGSSIKNYVILASLLATALLAKSYVSLSNIQNLVTENSLFHQISSIYHH